MFEFARNHTPVLMTNARFVPLVETNVRLVQETKRENTHGVMHGQCGRIDFLAAKCDYAI